MTSCLLVTPPVIEPVSVEEIKAQARLEGSDEDALLASLIIAARQWVELYTGRCLIKQGWRLWLDAEPDGDEIVLSKAPLFSVQEVQFFSDDDEAQTWDTSCYFIDTAREPGRVVLRAGAVWPASTRTANGLSVAFEAGYGERAQDVPEALRLAVRQLAAFWYENRGDSLEEGLSAAIPLVVYGLLQPYRLRSWRV